MEKVIRQMNFSADTTAKDIIRLNAELLAAKTSELYPNIIEKVVMNNYKEENSKVKQAILAYASQKAGIEVPTTKDEMMFAKDNAMFVSVLNSITVQSISYVMANYENPALMEFATVDTVEVGGSKTYTIDHKSLATPQRGNYTSNVTLVPSYAKQSVTITPKVYTLGVSLDYLRLIDDAYDWGAAVAKIYASFIYGQYKLIAQLVFNPAILNDTPLYSDAFSPTTYMQIADDVAMLNGGNASDVVAFGTRAALSKISGTAVTGGYSTKDEYIRGGILKEVAGIQSVVLDNFTNFNVPFNTANAPKLRALPNDLIVLVSRARDSIVKLVRESYIRVVEVEPTENNINRMEYSYTQAYDAAVITSSFFGIQKA